MCRKKWTEDRSLHGLPPHLDEPEGGLSGLEPDTQVLHTNGYLHRQRLFQAGFYSFKGTEGMRCAPGQGREGTIFLLYTSRGHSISSTVSQGQKG